MSTITYETEKAIFTFNLTDVTESLMQSNDTTDTFNKLLHHLSSSPPGIIKIPEENNNFGYITLDLLKKEKGSITCKACSKTYNPDQLKPTIIGHGTSPFNLKEKGGIKKLLKKGQRLPGLFGGRGFDCPQGHELISMITWRT